MKNKQTLYWSIGAGVTAAAIIATVIIIRNRLKTKVDLSKFDSPDIPGSGKCMDKNFIKKLRQLEQKTKLPIFNWINSGARSNYWNTKVGGVSNSAHKIPNCKAADIKTPTKAIRDLLVRAAVEVGFKRIGIGNTFIHLDTDEAKPQYVAWGYSGKKPPYNPFA